MAIKPILRKNLFIFVLSVAMVCLIYSKFVLSMSLIGLLILIVFLREKDSGYIIHINTKLFRRESYKKLWPWTGFLIYFLWIIMSILWSSGNYAAWFHEVVGKLSLLGIPFIFLFIPRLSPREILLVHTSFYLALASACIMVLMVYVPQYEDITLRIGRGRPIPTPIDHVRFSIMVAYAGLSLLYFGVKKLSDGFRPKSIRILLYLGFLFFFIMTHVLAVRSGILLLYSGLILFIGHKIISQKSWKLGIIGLVGIILIPVLAYTFVPSFKNKVLYTKYDIQQYLSDNQDSYSDGDRIMSIKTGLKLWKENLWLGHGAGDYKQVIQEYYQKNAPDRKILFPHNQWVRTGMAYGLIGMIILLSGFLYAIFGHKGYKNLLLLMIFQLFFFSCLVESNLERYYGMVFFFLFIGLAAMERNLPEGNKLGG